MGFIDLSGHRPRAVATVGRTRAPAGWTAAPLSMGLGERRGLAEARPPCRIELILETLVAALQPIALPLGLRERVVQPRNLFLLTLDQRVAIIRRRRGLIGHTLLMPEG